MPSVVAAVLGMMRGTVRGVGTDGLHVIAVKPPVDGVHAADAGADDDGRARAGEVVAAKARLRHRLVGGDHGVLRERIAERQQIGFDVSRRLEGRNLGGELDAPVIGNFGAQFAHLRSAVPRRAPKLSRAHPGG